MSTEVCENGEDVWVGKGETGSQEEGLEFELTRRKRRGI